MKITFFLTLFAAACALAAGGEHHEEAIEIPFAQIGWQALNLGILLVGLFFALRKSIVATFAARRNNFLQQAEKTKSALKSAELALQDVKAKLNTLESGEAAALENAKHEANIVKAHLIRDAEAMSEKMKADLALTLKNELEKAKAEINTLILGQAISTVTQKMTDNAAQFSKESEASFLKQISQVKS